MPLADQSIIAPAGVASRAPLKKGTVAWLLGGVVLLAVIGVFAPRLMRGWDTPKESDGPKPAAQMVGKASTIDAEFDSAERKLANAAGMEALQGQSVALPPAAPLPAASRVGAVAAPQPARVDGGVRRAEQGGEVDPAVQIEAAGRNSKSLAVDDSASTGRSGGSTQGTTAVAELSSGGPANGASPEQDRSRSAVQALIDAQSKAVPLPVHGVSGDRAWLQEFAATATRSQAIRPYAVTNPYTLIQGKVIPAVLGRDLNTDLPGAVSACTTLDVYDSISSNYLLIPKGSCLSGKYSSAIRSGQERVMFAFSRIVLPNGLSFDLPGNAGSDLGGAAGVAGDVNNHFIQMFTSSLLIAVLADKAEANKPSPTTNTGSGGANSAAGQVLVEVSRSILDRNKVIPPTITVPKGTRINVEVTKDMEFPGPYRNR